MYACSVSIHLLDVGKDNRNACPELDSGAFRKRARVRSRKKQTPICNELDRR